MPDLPQLTTAIHSLVGLQFGLDLEPADWPPELQPVVRALSALGATLEQRVVSADHVGALFQATPVPLVQLSADLTVTATNPSARQLFGPGVEGLPLRTVLEDLAADPVLVVPTVSELMAGVRCTLLGVGGHTVVSELRLAPLFDRFRTLQGHVLSAHDVTHDVEAREQAERERAAAEAAKESRTRFLAMVSHELRTPLNGVVGMMGFLNHEDPQVRRQAAEVTQACAEQLSGLISEFLDFAQLSAGAETLDTSAIDLRHLVVQCGQAVAARLRPGVEWRVDRSMLTCAEVVGDATRLRQLVDNLLENACKYTDTGHVGLAVSSRQIGDDVTLVVVVEDTGRGIAADDLPHIFELYRRSTFGGGGHGLGLAIVRQLVSRLGGTIEVTSTVGVGTRFEVRLTMPAARSTTRAAPRPRVLAAPLRVLSVDDNEVNRIVVRLHLEAMGCVVEEAVDGVDCVERVEAKNGDFDVILMDCEMPRMTGPQASESLTKKGYRVPVVALTAHALSSQRADCKKSGMVEFLTKPVQAEQLYDVLRALVSEAPEVA